MGAGDGTGFEDFVSREQAALLRLAVLLAGDRGHAEDLVQTALLKTYRHWGRITGSGDPTAYVRCTRRTSMTEPTAEPASVVAARQLAEGARLRGSAARRRPLRPVSPWPAR